MRIKAEDKVKQPKACQDGKHVFIPCSWELRGRSKSCTLFICQHCLMTIDKREREEMVESHHSKIREKLAADGSSS